MTTLSTSSGKIEFGLGHPTLLINDTLNAYDVSDSILDSLASGNIDPLLGLAEQGKSIGVNTVDIMLDHPALDEVNLLPKVAKSIVEKCGCFISLDSRNPAALEAALSAIAPCKALINSVNSEKEVMHALFPVAARYRAAVAGIPVGHASGMNDSVEERISGARIIVQTASEYGIPQDDIVIDGVVMAAATQQGSMVLTLRTIKVLKEELGVTTILGVSNAGHGMPTPHWIEFSYLLAAIPWGMHAALVNPFTQNLPVAVLAADFLADRDPYGKEYIRYFRNNKAKKNE